MKCVLAAMLMVSWAISVEAAVVNPGFETGSFTSGWTAVAQSGSAGAPTVSSSTTAPFSGAATPGPASGSFYALTDNTGPSSEAFGQKFTAGPGPTTSFSFDVFFHSASALSLLDEIFDYTDPHRLQWAQVTVLDGSSGLFGPSVDVLYQFPNSLGWEHIDVVLNDLVPGHEYWFVGRHVSNQGRINLGLDNVSITNTPEPGSFVLAAIASLTLVGSALRRRFR